MSENILKKENIIIGILIIVVILLIIMNIHKSYQLSQLDEAMKNVKINYVNNYDNNWSDNNKKNELVLYFTNKCHFCLNFLPIWKSFKEKYKLYNFNIDIYEINCDENYEKCLEDGINAYPQVILRKKNGEIVEFVGNRTIENLENFVNLHNY